MQVHRDDEDSILPIHIEICALDIHADYSQASMKGPSSVLFELLIRNS